MLYKMSPARAFLYGVLVYAFIYMCFPVESIYTPSAGAVTYVFACSILFLMGALLGQVINSRVAKPAMMTFDARFYRQVTFVAMIGVFFKLIDKFLVRGISIAAGVENRDMLEDAGGSNVFSLFGGILYPFCYISAFVLLSAWSKGEKKKKVYYYLSFLMFMFPAFDSLVAGSRSLMLVNMTLLMLYGVYFRIIRFNFYSAMAVPVILSGVFLLSGYVFLNRLDYMGLDYLSSALNSVYAFTIAPNDWILGRIFNTETSGEFLVYYSILNMGQYFTHGLFEFFYLYDHFTAENTYGAYNFAIYVKFFLVFISDQSFLERVASAQPRVGTFTSFLGPVFVDFGLLGPIYMFLFGFISGKIWRKCVNGNLVWIPLYFYFVLMILFMPVVSFFVSAQGLYTMTAFIMFVVFSKFRRRVVHA